MNKPEDQTPKVVIVWGNWGPYHYARFQGFKKHLLADGMQPIGLELFPQSGVYEWEVKDKDDPDVLHLNLGSNETDFPLFRLISQVIPLIKKTKPAVVFVPSYWHWSLFINFISRLWGAKIVMMNETHGGTEKARGFKKWIKKQIVKKFHGALVGGQPHKRFFSDLGIPENNIEIGYDAIDNQLFSREADKARNQANLLRKQLGLPDRYFLSLSRLIEKKNLPRMVEAFSKIKPAPNHPPLHLVIVGSGDQEARVRDAVYRLNLPLIDHPEGKETQTPYDPDIPAVHFYGFRQIDQNPTFYALSECFLMPSVFEEWGLVTNEAMACSVPCITSSVAGCAEDLIIENVTGFTVPWDDVDALHQALEKFNKNPDLSRQLGSKAFEHIQKFGCDFFGSQSVLVARKVLESR